MTRLALSAKVSIPHAHVFILTICNLCNSVMVPDEVVLVMGSEDRLRWG